ncbi:MAG: RCC1 domain-containing protein, partial [Limisphaerales bacterium]
PTQIISNGVVAVACGAYHSLFLKSDGSLWGMGWNNYGELGDGTTNIINMPELIVSSDVVKIAAGAFHSMFLKSDGSLWAMGRNAVGGLGDGFNDSYPYSLVPEQIYPLPQPLLTSSISSQTNLQFKATCQLGGIFYLLSSTNIDQPLSQWTPVWTNLIDFHSINNFNATITNSMSSNAGQFYILKSQ